MMGKVEEAELGREMGLEGRRGVGRREPATQRVGLGLRFFVMAAWAWEWSEGTISGVGAKRTRGLAAG